MRERKEDRQTSRERRGGWERKKKIYIYIYKLQRVGETETESERNYQAVTLIKTHVGVAVVKLLQHG